MHLIMPTPLFLSIQRQSFVLWTVLCPLSPFPCSPLSILVFVPYSLPSVPLGQLKSHLC